MRTRLVPGNTASHEILTPRYDLTFVMMIRCITTMCLLAAVIPILLADLDGPQTGSSASEPHYLNTFYALDSSGKLIDLERKTATFHAKTKALPGYATVKMLAEITPAQSPVRLEGVGVP